MECAVPAGVRLTTEAEVGSLERTIGDALASARAVACRSRARGTGWSRRGVSAPVRLRLLRLNGTWGPLLVRAVRRGAPAQALIGLSRQRRTRDASQSRCVVRQRSCPGAGPEQLASRSGWTTPCAGVASIAAINSGRGGSSSPWPRAPSR